MSHFDTISNAYSIYSNQFHGEIYHQMANLINPRIVDKSVLDIGNGGYFPYDLESVSDITAVDISANMLDKIDHPKINKVVDDARYLAHLEDGQFDVVMLCFVIHHINGTTVKSAKTCLQQVIDTSYAKLKPGGRLIIGECVLNRLLHSIERLTYPLVYRITNKYDSGMVFFHHREDIIAAMRRAMSDDKAVVDEIKIKLTQPVDPLVGTFPGLISIPAWMNLTNITFFDCVKPAL